MKKLKFKNSIVITFLAFLVLTGCYHFNFVNQPYTADPDSSFEVQISVITDNVDQNVNPYFGVLLPIGWSMIDSIEYSNDTTNTTGFIVYSDSLSQEMSVIDTPPENYYWWVGVDDISVIDNSVYTLEFTIETDAQTGNFFLDYMLGDSQQGLNFRRSNDHLIIVGDVEGCLPEGITFSSQAEIDNFQANYPGCTEIAGSITVSGDNIINLNGLSNLTSIGGHLFITDNDSLTSLGLANLSSIGGTLSIKNNLNLTSLSGMDNLGFIGRDLKLEYTMLSSLSGLDNLISIGRNLSITYNDSLTSLSGLGNLSFIGGYLNINTNAVLTSLNGLEGLISIGEYLAIRNNDALMNLTGLEGLTSIGEYLIFDSNDALTGLSGLEGLTSIGGSFDLSNNAALISPTGLDNLVSIGGNLYVGSNAALTSLTGLNNVATIGEYLAIRNNDALTNLTGLEGLTSIAEYLDLYSNSALTSLSGLNNVISVGGYLNVYDNDAMTSLNGLESLTSIGGYLDIDRNDALSSVFGLDNLTSIGGYLALSYNDALTNLSGFDNLTSVGGFLSIKFSAALTSLTGLESLNAIGEYLGLAYNPALTSLTGLEGLTSIGGYLRVSSNNALTSLTGLDNLEASSIDNLTIAYNPYLSSCEAEFICEYLSSPNGEISIHDNAPGCNSMVKLAYDCGLTLPCLTDGNYNLYSQDDIDYFPLVFAGCDTLMVGLTISGNDITDLDGLEVITSVGGALIITGNPILTSLSGLHNVTSIGETLEISYNEALTNLEGLDNISANARTDLIIRYNTLLSSCEARSICDYLANPNGSVQISNNATGCRTRYQVEDACESLCLYDGITFTTQEEIDEFWDNHPGCAHIQGDVRISGADINSLNGLSSIISIGGNLIIDSNAVLTSLRGLHRLTSIDGDLIIESNNALISLSDLVHLAFIRGALTIESNAALTNLAGLEKLTSIGNALTVMANNSLTSLWGLENIQFDSVTDLYIVDNVVLSECDIQSVCQYLANPGGIVEISNNAAGCNNQQEVEDACAKYCLYDGIDFTTQAQIDNFQTNYPVCTRIEGTVKIGGSDINNLNGLNSLTSISGGLRLGYYVPGGANPVLNNISGLSNLTSIGGLSVISNPVLTNLSGLDSLSSIGGLHIWLNRSLSDISALSNIDSAFGLIIAVNNSLSECDIESICRILADPSGVIYIEDNAPGCNDRYEVEAACPVYVDEVKHSDKLFIYPNPSTTQITVELTDAPNNNAVLSIYNMNSRQMLTSKISEQKTVVDISSLPKGFYFVKVPDDRTMKVGKLVKK